MSPKQPELNPTLTSALQIIDAKIREAKQKNDSGTYIALGGTLLEMRNICRELFQSMTQVKISVIIQKLKRNQPLSSEDLQNVRLWIVGDVDRYIEIENNFSDWVKEAERLADEIKRLDGKLDTVEGVCTLQALLTDLDQTTQEITRYLQGKERIALFENATREIDPMEAKTLVEILTRKFDSSNE